MSCDVSQCNDMRCDVMPRNAMTYDVLRINAMRSKDGMRVCRVCNVMAFRVMCCHDLLRGVMSCTVT